MVYGKQKLGHMTENLVVNFLPDATAKMFGEYTTRKYMKNPTDPAFNLFSNLEGKEEEVKTKLATEGRGRGGRRPQQAAIPRRPEIRSE